MHMAQLVYKCRLSHTDDRASYGVKGMAKSHGCFAYLEELKLGVMKGSMKGRVIDERLKLSSKKGTFHKMCRIQIATRVV